MTIFSCEDNFTAMLTCIYDAWASRLGHANVRLVKEPVFQQELFCDYIHVDADLEKADKVLRSVKNKISYRAAYYVCQAIASCEDDALDSVYRFLILGFHYGDSCIEMYGNPIIMRFFELSRRVGKETGAFLEFVRFDAINPHTYISHIEPKNNIVLSVAEHFADRMPSENWMIIDDNRRVAAVHSADSEIYLRTFTDDEMERLSKTEDINDGYTDLWKAFFDAIAIKERKNPRCQMSHFTIIKRKHVTEFR